MPTFEEIAERFGPLKPTTNGVMTRCPAHDDHNPSLHLLRGDEAVGVWCYAGCDKREVIDAAGLDWVDLRYEPKPEVDVRGRQPDLSLDMSYTYVKPDGSTWMTVERWHRADGSKTFRQRGPDGNYSLPRGFKPCLYRLDEVLPAAKDGQEIWIAEGEKDADSLRFAGVTATTAPMGAGKWRSWYWHWLRGAARVLVVADNDEPGRRHAAAVSEDLTAHGLKVHVVRARQGKDASEHLRYGHGLDDFVPFNPNRLRPAGVSFTDLLGKRFDPIDYAVPGILPTGLALLGAPPKKGKSFTAHDLGLAVASGGVSFLGARGNQGDVLYLALDNDSERRLADRTRLILANTAAHRQLPIEFHTEWPVGVEAIAACRDWIKEVPCPRLIVVDTLVRVEPSFDSPNYGAYSHSTEALSRWADLANEGNVTILAIHHDRKGGLSDGDDWIDRFTGSRGITAVAATLLFIDAERGAHEGTLHMTGRDVGDFDIPLMLQRPLWKAQDLPHGALRALAPNSTEDLPPQLRLVEGEVE